MSQAFRTTAPPGRPCEARGCRNNAQWRRRWWRGRAMETAEVCDEHDRALVAVGASEPPLFQVIDIEQLGRDHDRPSRRPPPSGVRPMPPPIPFPRSTPARTAPSAQESVMTEPTPITSSPPKRVCRVPGCRDRHAAHGLCGRHNGRVALMRLRDELPTWTDEDFAAFDVRWEAHTAKKNTQVVEATTPVDTDTDSDRPPGLLRPAQDPGAHRHAEWRGPALPVQSPGRRLRTRPEHRGLHRGDRRGSCR